MVININDVISVNKLRDGTILVTRPSIFGKVASHILKTAYSAEDIAIWLYHRSQGKAPLIQNAFPDMSKEDREFLLSGITPEEWRRIFPPEANQGGHN